MAYNGLHCKFKNRMLRFESLLWPFSSCALEQVMNLFVLQVFQLENDSSKGSEG